jgi:GntR family transcriptional regulator
MSEIRRAGALYRQVAAAMREGITTGGVPSRRATPSQPSGRRGSSTSSTAKAASYAAHPPPVLTIERTMNRDSSSAFTVNDAADWQKAEEAHVYRTGTAAADGPCRA